MKRPALSLICLALSLSASPALDEADVVTDFQFQSQPDPVQDVSGKATGTFYKGLEVVSPSYAEQESQAGLAFSGDGGLVIPAAGLRYAETSLGIFLRLWVEELPKSTVTVAAQQGKFYIELQPGGFVSVRIAGTPDQIVASSQPSKLRILAGTWNEILLTYDQGRLELVLNGQPADSLDSSSSLAGSANPLTLGGFLAKPGTLETTPDNHWKGGFTGWMQRFLITRVPVVAGDLALPPP